MERAIGWNNRETLLHLCPKRIYSMDSRGLYLQNNKWRNDLDDAIISQLSKIRPFYQFVERRYCRIVRRVHHNEWWNILGLHKPGDFRTSKCCAIC